MRLNLDSTHVKAGERARVDCGEHAEEARRRRTLYQPSLLRLQEVGDLVVEGLRLLDEQHVP
jgi:hypothetical protein